DRVGPDPDLRAEGRCGVDDGGRMDQVGHAAETLPFGGAATASESARTTRSGSTSGGAVPVGRPTTTTRGPRGAQTAGSVGPNTATVGTHSAAARWLAPESLPANAAARSSSRANATIESGSTRSTAAGSAGSKA